MSGQLFGHWLLIQSPISHLQSLRNRTESLDLLMGGSSDLGPSPEATEEYTESPFISTGSERFERDLLWLTKPQPLQLNGLGNTRAFILTKMLRSSVSESWVMIKAVLLMTMCPFDVCFPYFQLQFPWSSRAVFCEEHVAQLLPREEAILEQLTHTWVCLCYMKWHLRGWSLERA